MIMWVLIMIPAMVLAASPMRKEPDQHLKSSEETRSDELKHQLLNSTEDVWHVRLGDICQITRFPLPAGESGRYLECIRPFENETQWPWSDKGIWVLRQCPKGFDFHSLSSSCRSRRYIRRQQSMCGQNPNAQFCPQPQQPQYPVQPQNTQMACQCPPSVSVCVCPQPQGYQPTMQMPQQPQPPMQMGGGGYGMGGGGGQQGCMPAAPVNNCPQPPQPCPLAQGNTQNAQAGEMCSWMLAPLAADRSSNKCFLQCVPAPGNAYCGRWVRMPCAPGTVFDVQVQVCVHDSYNTPGQVPQMGAGGGAQCQTGTPIGSCNVNMQCPGQSVCQTPQQPASQQCQQQPQQCSVCCYTGGMGGGGGAMPGPGAMGGGGMLPAGPASYGGGGGGMPMMPSGPGPMGPMGPAAPMGPGPMGGGGGGGGGMMMGYGKK